MNRALLTQASIKFLAGILLTGLLVFLPAGSFDHWQGWLLIVILFLSRNIEVQEGLSQTISICTGALATISMLENPLMALA